MAVPKSLDCHFGRAAGCRILGVRRPQGEVSRGRHRHPREAYQATTEMLDHPLSFTLGGLFAF